jgi:protein-L-isoaspartate(D-aspartate) O-methyltransferase
MQVRPGSVQGEFSLARRRLAEQLRASGVRDTRVLRAFDQVPRHRLVPEALWGQAYRDTPLPIGEGQTISAPGVVANMTQALSLEGDERVLEIGTGSGYQAAILSRLVAQVISVERIDVLARAARQALDDLGVTNVTLYLGDGTQGRPDDAPYDRIVVTAGGPEVPIPLLDQLEIGGLLVGPFGQRDTQELMRIQRTSETRYTREVLGRCQFVDLIGENGWAA